MILILTYHLEKVGIYKGGCYELFLVWTLPKVQYIRFNFHPIYSPNAGIEMVEAFLRKSFGENWEVPVRDQISWIIRGGSCTFPKDAQILWTYFLKHTNTFHKDSEISYDFLLTNYLKVKVCKMWRLGLGKLDDQIAQLSIQGKMTP